MKQSDFIKLTEFKFKSIFECVYQIGGSYTILAGLLAVFLSYSIYKDQERSLLESVMDKPEAEYDIEDV